MTGRKLLPHWRGLELLLSVLELQHLNFSLKRGDLLLVRSLHPCDRLLKLLAMLSELLILSQ